MCVCVCVCFKKGLAEEDRAERDKGDQRHGVHDDRLVPRLPQSKNLCCHLMRALLLNKQVRPILSATPLSRVREPQRRGDFQKPAMMMIMMMMMINVYLTHVGH